MKNILYMALFETKTFFRQPVAVFWVIGFPLILFFIFGSIFGRFSKPHVSIALCKNDQSKYTRNFIGHLSQNQLISIKTVNSKKEVADSVKSGNKLLGIHLPSDFGQKLKLKKPSSFNLLYDEENSQENKIALSILNQDLLKFVIKSEKIKSVIKYEMHEVKGATKESSYIEFLLPGIIGLIILTNSLFSIGLKILIYKENNILKQFSLLPISKLSFIFAQSIPYLVINTILSVILIYLGKSLFGIQLPASFTLIIIYLIFGFIVLSLIGISLISFVTTVQQGSNLINLTFFFLMFTSGIYFPVSSMPAVFEVIGNISPLTYFIDILRELFAAKINPYNVGLGFAVLTGWSILSLLIIKFKFKWAKE
ncbi:ABC transporter permease [Spirochaetota bacterium]